MSKQHEEVVESMTAAMNAVVGDEDLGYDAKAICALLVNLVTVMTSIDRRLWALESWLVNGETTETR